MYKRQERSSSKLEAFTITTDEYERAVSLVSGRAGSVPPIALEFAELLRELGAWEASDDEASDTEGAEAAAAAAAAAAAVVAEQLRYEELMLRRETNKREAEEAAAARKKARQVRVVVDGDVSE